MRRDAGGIKRRVCGLKASDGVDQSDAIAFLENGAGIGRLIKRVDTHGAMIFLIDDMALKIKRQVTYDYMDLSTLDKRRAMLEREFELNRPFAPQVYREVLPLVRMASGELSLGGSGKVVEWVLSMNRFPEEAELTHIARHTGIDDDLAERLGQSIAAYHAAVPIKDLDAAILMEEILEELERVFAPMGTVFEGDARAFVEASRQTWAGNRNTLGARAGSGHVRRGHGDLHLRNIVMLDGVPTPFDALEFDERLGTCDTLYDLAFLLMDLDHLRMRHAANVVLNAYLAQDVLEAQTYGLQLLPLYLSVRAAIRAMVDVQSARFAPNATSLTRDARTYMHEALGYLEPKPPMLVAIGGYSGTGKTTIARAIAHWIGAAPGAIVIRSDVLRKTLMNCDPLERLGPEGYASDISAKTYATMRVQAGHVLRQGHSAILDAVHGTLAERRAVEDLSKAQGCTFCGIWLQAETPTRVARVAARGPDASDADAHVVHSQAAKDPGNIHWHHVNADQPVDAVVRAVKDILQTDRDQPAC